MANINISNIRDIQTIELEELDLLTDSKGYLKELPEQEKSQIKGASACMITYDFDLR